jgi:Uma2 family endonuclease
MNIGIEPDDSFYIQNHLQMIGKQKIDLTIDPPPDLVIEIDVTSKTQLDAYLALAVPEVWRYEDDKLYINILQNGKYIESEVSPNFPNLPILPIIPQFVQESRILGRSPTLRKFRQWIKQN